MSPSPVRVLFVCLGNICRSPLAEGQFRAHVERAGLSHRFVIDSAGTSGYHAGELPDPGSISVARQHGIDIGEQRSRALRDDDVTAFDFVVCMDRKNLRAVSGSMPKERAFVIREFDPEATGSLDVPDPWGGGANGFVDVYKMLDRCLEPLAEYMLQTGPVPRRR